MEQWSNLIGFVCGAASALFWVWLLVIRPLNDLVKRQSDYIMVHKDSTSYYATQSAVRHAPSDSDVESEKAARRKDQEYIKAMTSGVVDDDVIELVGTKDGVIS